jgi:hypothetical protein
MKSFTVDLALKRPTFVRLRACGSVFMMVGVHSWKDDGGCMCARVCASGVTGVDRWLPWPA